MKLLKHVKNTRRNSRKSKGAIIKVVPQTDANL